jgi:hypothetical protein
VQGLDAGRGVAASVALTGAPNGYHATTVAGNQRATTR